MPNIYNALVVQGRDSVGQPINVSGDVLTDPAPEVTTFAHLDATTVLSRGLAAKGIYPAVDPLDSTSTMLQPRIVGEEHYETAQRVKQTLQRYKELQDILDPWIGRIIQKRIGHFVRERKIERFLSLNPFRSRSIYRFSREICWSSGNNSKISIDPFTEN
ncbi:hypothetical protein HAX54_029269 [Datura stramonium]|uniref:H(+)-transporting two-sector ATPase n=1 Tax=Datura stramonium TaxID=4076 RepID=A0ABS8V7S0_DATST|nr:hypothetical protein [Datura stramonium]